MTAKPVADKVEAVAVELRLDQILRLYNSLDPAPFHERELGSGRLHRRLRRGPWWPGDAVGDPAARVRTGTARGRPDRPIDPQPLRLARRGRTSAPARRMAARPHQPGDRPGLPGRLPVRPRTAGILGISGVARPRRRVPDHRLGGFVGADRRVPLWLVADRRPAPAAREPGAARRRGAADQMSWGPFIITNPTTIT